VTIVVGYDGEPAAQQALERALEEARGSAADLVVIAVLQLPLNPEGPQTFGTWDDSPATMLPLEAPPEVESILAEARERVEAAGGDADYVWAAGEPANAILGTARDRGASLVVLGSHHHSMFGRLFGEDIAAAVKRDAGCDVLVVE